MLHKRLYSFYQKTKNREVLSKLNELEKNQWLSSEELEELQNKRLLDIINLATNNVPYYRKIKEELGISLDNAGAKDTIAQFPILTKHDIIKNYNMLINPKYNGKVYKKISGGSTGTPVKLLEDKESYEYSLAAAMRSDRWANWNFGFSMFKLWGASRDFQSQYKERLKRFLFKQYMFDAFNWNKDTIVNIHTLMGKRKPDIILAYSSAIYFYVETVKAKRLPRNHFPKGIITSADMLYEYQRKEIEEYFNCEVFNRYGCREVGLIACECEEHSGLHISSDRLYIEVVDEKNNPVSDGEIGKILITDLTNIAMPIIRYEIGDVGSLSFDKNCPCGRGLPKLESIQGRITDYIVDNRGNHIRVPAYIVAKIKNIEQLQLIQKTYDSIVVRVVKDNKYNKKDEQNIVNQLKKYIGDNIDYKFEYVDSVINNKSGKYRFIINEMKQS